MAAGPDVLAFLADDDGRSRILTEGKLPLGSHFRVAEHGQGNELVVVARFRIMQNLGHHLVVFAAQHEGVVMRGLTGEDGKRFGIDHKHFAVAPFFNFDIVGCQKIIFRGVR